MYHKDFGSVRTLLLTHSDHFYVEDLLMRSSCYGCTSSFPLAVYGNDRCREKFEYFLNSIEFSGDESLKRLVRFFEIEAYSSFITSCGYHVTALPASHAPYEKCLCYDIEKNGKRLLYLHDTGIPEEPGVYEHVRNRRYDLVYFDATIHGDSDSGTWHMGLGAIGRLCDKFGSLGSIEGWTRLVANHFSHAGGLDIGQLEKIAARRGLVATHDGISIEF